jgi:hypothetical protein
MGIGVNQGTGLLMVGRWVGIRQFGAKGRLLNYRSKELGGV